MLLTSVACGGEPSEERNESSGPASSEPSNASTAPTVADLCPLTAAKLSLVLGSEVLQPTLQDYAEHGFRDLYGETVLGCLYERAAYDDPGAPTVELVSIQTSATDGDRAAF